MHSAIKISKKIVDLSNENNITDMTLLKLMKMTYIAHGWMLGLYARPFISEDVEAWKHGPVIPELYKATQRFGKVPITALAPITDLDDELDIEMESYEDSIIQQTFDNYSKWTAWQLVKITHEKGTPWHITKTKYGTVGRGIIIEDEIIQEYYTNLANGYKY